MMNEKIKQLLIDKNLTPSRFADEIGVQRPSISHILSGRNKPSLEVIQKIMRRYPDIQFEWFSDAEIEQPEIVPYNAQNQPITSHKTGNSVRPELNRKILPDQNTTQLNVKPTTKPLYSENPEKQIQKILVFYTDNTFTEYKPFS